MGMVNVRGSISNRLQRGAVFFPRGTRNGLVEYNFFCDKQHSVVCSSSLLNQFFFIFLLPARSYGKAAPEFCSPASLKALSQCPYVLFGQLVLYVVPPLGSVCRVTSQLFFYKLSRARSCACIWEATKI